MRSEVAALFDLTGRTALVTGASSGIGAAVAAALDGAGARVLRAGRDRGRLGPDGISVDLAGGVEDLIAAVDARADAVDILINCAGTNPRPPLGEISDALYREILAVNLDAPFVLGQHYGPRMAERGWGRIVNVASTQAHRAFGNSGAYGVAKAGITGLTRSQSEAWAPRGVTANSLTPGLVATPMTTAVLADPARADYFRRRAHTGTLGAPSDFAAAAVFLSGEGARFVTGQNLCVDGGLSVT
ncbi:Short-chain dehydrogenase/reductase SDR OS=Tsukamurella paurometabola (strain ATCC 8368 / DSM/ CCUG 35730 / CIP 100753 / JCM 10117 / KCTC 9821 / NBRC 16120/ NCIMB 702349 / NCTC 13040) OX=521096 GN=Tpau_1688 PE=3 SV=1 [Tsukamurella paurometabola]|uniref:Short-chain dehydrogenase/reductase SDR n=1 Tax=Tsukamurella paurometabola (strain ATCC 8368 / DSM 20162 / CCUG 35730 / CIP 100753 / JCM 10117 / KCTC 9821 / NBRC 16120 / NCIMB 702349 / NCTC 13040) TaxID=521096 RepID=D5UM27_TSUPD|nr:SDR family oxidoreductase [Tsukamurella paurometabola]ADG78307.1 short-chain dehydrogenase/reductase SDR [Tsukamurella paurometabola DSM 20162]SUP31134.1 Gluconate 5-dehydrogenase [Tsukamurella paurometabola]